MMRQLFFYVCVMMMIGSSVIAAPGEICFQGALSKPNGEPLNEQVNVIFSAYSAASGGTAAWTETQSITVIDGIYTAALGAITPFPADLFDQPEVWLGIKVGTETEMSPRVRLLAVPYALHAKVADTVKSAPSASWFTHYIEHQSGNTPKFAFFGSTMVTVDDEATTMQMAPADGIITDLYLCPKVALSGNEEVSMTIRINQADTTLKVVQDSTTGTTCVTASGPVSVNKGDRLSLSVESNNVNNGTYHSYNIGFLYRPNAIAPQVTQTPRGPSIISGGTEANFYTWADILTGGAKPTEAESQFPVTRSGTIKNLIVRFHNGGADLTDSNITLKLRVNGADTPLILTYNETADGKTVVRNSGTSEVNVSKGDLISFSVTNSVGDPAGGSHQVRVLFELE